MRYRQFSQIADSRDYLSARLSQHQSSVLIQDPMEYLCVAQGLIEYQHEESVGGKDLIKGYQHVHVPKMVST